MTALLRETREAISLCQFMEINAQLSHDELLDEAAEQYSVLIIEGSADDLLVVRSSLMGDGRFSVHHAATLAEGIERLQSDREMNGVMPDAITLDLNLPDSSGLETFSRIHQLFPDEPLIILTDEHDERFAVEAMRLGAQDYVHKSSLDGRTLVRALLYAIERNKRRLAEHRQRAVEREVDFAAQIQQHLLPKASPEIAGFDVAGLSVSAESASGDFYDFIDHGDGKWDIVLADVCGHGIGPAMITVGTRRLLRSCAALHEDVGDLMTIANRGICEDTFKSLFVTLFFVRLDPRHMRLEYVGAGHLAFLIDIDGVVTDLTTCGIPTGVDPSYLYRADGMIEVSTGQIVLLMSDGIWEAQKDEQEPFGMHRACEIAYQYRDQSASEISNQVISAVKAYCYPQSVQDDMTVVVIKVQ
ncbi:MAG: response regulator [Planctomycetales bacterium]|nr:response regulator [Planctomycetales bacterium]